jgi:alpha-glucosidase
VTSQDRTEPADPRWWRRAVVYQIYPRSFADGTGDGVGDLPGATAHLSHLRDLGVDAVWFSPFFRSPMADFGYDISDHCDVDPLFGSLEDADRLVETAHDLGLKVVLDFVPGHTSDQHPWFLESRSSRDNPKRDWYVWRDPAPDGGPPTDWVAAFGAYPAWTLDDATGQYYLHLFLPEQPDLDWNNPEVAAAMTDVLRFWSDRGVDGFRIDVVHTVGKQLDVDSPPELKGIPACIFDHGPGVHACLRRLRTATDRFDRPPLLVGETYVFERERVVEFLGDDDELHLGFNIPALHAPWDAQRWAEEIQSAIDLYEPVDGWPCWVLSNHDVKRHRTRYGSEARARAAAVLLLTLRGTPFLYQGEELGLEDADVPEDRVVDPGGRDGCRAPIPWDDSAHCGWPADPWLPFAPDAAERSVARQTGDPASMLEHYRRLLHLRRRLPVLQDGRIELLDAPDGVLRFRRWLDRPTGEGPSSVEVLVNFTDEEVAVPGAGGTWLGGTTIGERGPDGDAPLGPDEARVVDRSDG